MEVLSGPGVLLDLQGGGARYEVSLHGESHLLGPLSVTPRFGPLATAPTSTSPNTSSYLTPGMLLLVVLVAQSSLIVTPWAVAH